MFFSICSFVNDVRQKRERKSNELRQKRRGVKQVCFPTQVASDWEISNQVLPWEWCLRAADTVSSALAGH